MQVDRTEQQVGRKPRTELSEDILLVLRDLDDITSHRGAVGIRQLARWLGESHQTIHNHTNRLTDAGLVETIAEVSEVRITGPGRIEAARIAVSRTKRPSNS